MKKVLVSLLIGVSLFSIGCGGVKTHKEGYLNVNTDMENYGEQFNEGTKIIGKGVLGSKDNIGYGIKYITYMHKEEPWEQFLEFNYDDFPKIYEDYNLHMGDYIYFEGVLNEDGEIDIENIEVIDSPTESLK